MDKIWIIINNSRYAKKTKIYKTEKELLKNIVSGSSQEIFEYKLITSSKSVDFFKERDRDIQIRTVLGELDSSEENSINLINYYEEHCPIGREYKKWNGNVQVKTNEKNEHLLMLRKFQSDKSAVAAYLVRYKKYFITCLTTIEWYKNILSCHRFINHIYDSKSWNNEIKKYIIIDKSPAEIKDNFIEARKLLRKKK